MSYYNLNISPISFDKELGEVRSWRLTKNQRLLIRETERSIDRLVESRTTDGSYDYIPLPPERFLRLLHRAYKTNPKARKFLEIGCGPGYKMILAKKLIPTLELIDGIEKLRNFNVFSHELSTLNINMYIEDIYHYAGCIDKYDIIYTYKPIMDRLQMNCLFEKIRQNMKPGAIYTDYLLGNYYSGKDRSLYIKT